jgi:carbonic anhydrase
MEDLISGYRRFRAGMWSRERQRFEELSRDGQRPKTLVVACSDSRTDPQMVFNARPGELFVIRNVANLVPPYGPDLQYHGTSAALEFGVRELKVQRIVVLGHAMCGGIDALLHGGPAAGNDFVGNWMHIAEPARQRALEMPAEQRQGECERESVRLSLDNLLTFPWIKDAVTQGRLKLHGCFFDIRSGILETLGDEGVFHPVAADAM